MYISIDVRHNMDKKHWLFLPTLVTSCGTSGSQKQLHIAFERSDSFPSSLGVSGTVGAAACHRFVQRLKDITIIRIMGRGQSDNVKILTPLKVFLGNTCRCVVSTGDGYLLQNGEFYVLSLPQIVRHLRNGMLTRKIAKGD